MNARNLPDEIRNLPSQLTPFVGREHEIADITNLLAMPTCRLLTLTGPGGIGKTRLALEAARLQLDAFENDVHFVPLQPLASHSLIIFAIIDSLKLAFNEQDPKTQLLNYLREKHLLLMLDNFEHLLDGAEMMSDILAHAAGVKILATSRERLNLLEEWVLDVQGLPFPGNDAETEIMDYSAVQLFLQNAQRVQVGFTLTEAHRPAVIRICRLVEGMPLGIELASAWVRAMSCEEIASEIEHSLDILATPARNIAPRHRTMRAVLEHSWNLLNEIERDVFKKLSVFRGGFRREAAQVVAGASLQTLTALVDKSLLRVDGAGRYDLHELLRQYAHQLLSESGEARTTSDRHRYYYLAFAEKAEPELFGANQIDWFEQVETEHSNLRTAIDWSLESGDIESGLHLTSSLYWFWTLHSYHREGYERLIQLLSLPEVAGRTAVRAKALNAAGFIQWFERHYAEAQLLLEEAIDIARQADDLRELCKGLCTLGPVLYSLGQYERAGSSLEESLSLARGLKNPFGIAWSLVFLGDVALKLGNTDQAQILYEEGIEFVRELGDKTLLAYAVRRLGFVVAGYKDYEQAKALCRESMRLNMMTGHHRAVAAGLIGLAGIAIMQGEAVHAAQLLGAAERLLEEITAHLLLTDQIEYERHLKIVASHLDTATFNRAWAAGQSMTMKQAVACALEEPVTSMETTSIQQPARQPLIDPLSERELEIIRLLAAGLSYQQIAEKLTLAVGSVKSHCHNIYMKLGVHNRTQAVSRAIELRLL